MCLCFTVVSFFAEVPNGTARATKYRTFLFSSLSCHVTFSKSRRKSSSEERNDSMDGEVMKRKEYSERGGGVAYLHRKRPTNANARVVAVVAAAANTSLCSYILFISAKLHSVHVTLRVVCILHALHDHPGFKFVVFQSTVI